MDIVFAARNHLHPSFVPPDEEYVEIVLETMEKTTKLLPDLSNYGCYV